LSERDISDRIKSVLDARKSQEPLVEREIAYWENIQGLLGQLDRVVRDLRDDDSGNPAVAQVADLDVPALRTVASETLAALAHVRARVSRKTINIGVSGRARMGKSTLLQSLSGLGDNQIPAGEGPPVTAVRSRIFHSLTQSRAVLTTHTEASFCAQILAAYHAELGLPSAPATLAEFADYRYPPSVADLGSDKAERVLVAPLLKRLREMQESLPYYRQYLTGERRAVKLADLRKWVAYPADVEPGTIPERLYLSVKEALITCPFPLDEAIDLALVDLPGLGEVVAGADARHLEGLVNDVDFVIMVKRPTPTEGMWRTEDGECLKLSGQAAGAAAIRDFVALLVNSGGCKQPDINALRTAITKDVNEGVDGRFYRVITADAKDRTAVREEVLGPVLDHLAVALPRMDAAVIEHARELSAAGRQRLLSLTDGLLAGLRSIMTPTPVEELIARATELREEVAGSLQDWIDALRERAAEGYADDEFYDRVEEVKGTVKDWILDGFGEGQDAWTDRALKQMRVNKSSASFAEDALNSIRVEISRRLGDIDDLLERRRRGFWAGLLAALGPRFGALADPAGDPQAALGLLAERLREASDPCPMLAESLDLALDVRLDYRTRALPKVRQALEVLLPHPGTGGAKEMASLLDVPLTGEGAKEIYTSVSDMARQALHDAGQVLAREPGTTNLVLFAYGEQFEDAFIRSDASEGEFRRLAEAFRDQLWPGDSNGPATATARVQRARTALTNLKRALEEPIAPTPGGVQP
jgi:hypothetical protein